MKIWSALIVLKITHWLYLLNSSTLDVCKYSKAVKPLHFHIMTYPIHIKCIICFCGFSIDVLYKVKHMLVIPAQLSRAYRTLQRKNLRRILCLYVIKTCCSVFGEMNEACNLQYELLKP